jgi:hypothetical protein
VASDQFLCPVRSVRITRHSSRRFGFLEPLFFRLEQATRKQRTLVPSLDTAFRFRFAGCEAEQPTRRALLSASRRLLLLRWGAASCFPARKEEGPGNKTRGRGLPLVAACAQAASGCLGVFVVRAAPTS